ncbi:MAG TPA: hypothetical protein VFL79_06960 [Terriglobia bacterium]|nr:hypothetical protein [Terriglobia bacterium]
MMRLKLKWLLPVVLAGIFAAAYPSFAEGQYEHGTPGNRVDRRQDRRALRRQSWRVVRREDRLRTDVRRFGPNSAQARIDRRQVKRAKHQFRRQARDLRQDRRQAFRR